MRVMGGGRGINGVPMARRPETSMGTLYFVGTTPAFQRYARLIAKISSVAPTLPSHGGGGGGGG